MPKYVLPIDLVPDEILEAGSLEELKQALRLHIERLRIVFEDLSRYQLSHVHLSEQDIEEMTRWEE